MLENKFYRKKYTFKTEDFSEWFQHQPKCGNSGKTSPLLREAGELPSRSLTTKCWTSVGPQRTRSLSL